MDILLPTTKMEKLKADIKSGKVKIPECGKAEGSDKFDPRKELKKM